MWRVALWMDVVAARPCCLTLLMLRLASGSRYYTLLCIQGHVRCYGAPFSQRRHAYPLAMDVRTQACPPPSQFPQHVPTDGRSETSSPKLAQAGARWPHIPPFFRRIYIKLIWTSTLFTIVHSFLSSDTQTIRPFLIMPGALILINGFPGVGKHAVAAELV